MTTQRPKILLFYVSFFFGGGGGGGGVWVMVPDPSDNSFE